MSEALFLGFIHQRKTGTPVTGTILQEKVLIFHKDCKWESTFTASTDWTDQWGWKQKGNIKRMRHINIYKDLLTDLEIIFWNTEDNSIIFKRMKVSHDRLYKYAKTRLNFKKLQSKTVASCKEKSAPGYKWSKEQMMLPVWY